MNDNVTEAAIRTFLLQEILYDKNLADIGLDQSLIDKGLLDSLGVLKVVTFCEEHFGVTIPDEQLLAENLETVRAMAALVERCRAGTA